LSSNGDDTMRLRSLSTFITGGSSGIGLATAEAFVAQGATVAITGRDRSTLDAVTGRLGKSCKGFIADSSDDGAVGRALADAAGSNGIDVLFVNAGNYVHAPLGQASRAEIEHQMKVVANAFMTVQLALPHFNEGASIILMGSVYATMGPPGGGAYAASKAAVAAMARSMASELASRSIRVNVVVPGAIDTPSWSHDSMEPAEQARHKHAIGERALINRMVTADEVANAVVFLASRDSSGVNAAEIIVDGGTTGAVAGTPRYARGEP
jgi:NAD(P)-dependent dehydrogenase (short-subunit alcohol dehydrogenase family)